MFGRKSNEAPAEQTPVVEQVAARPVTGKGAPTPKQKDQVAARRRPLVPDDRKEAKVQERAALAEQRARVNQAMNTGDEKYLPVRDKGLQKRFARDFVDARFNLGEYLMFGALIFVVVSLIVPQGSQAQIVILLAFWAVFLLVFLDTFWLSRRLKKALTTKFGEIERGTIWYGSMRALQFRRLRMPKALVRRGEYPS